jgi:hypothetical protein
VHISILNLFTSFNVEEKARAKDERSKGAEGRMAKVKLNKIRITNQSNLLPLRRRIIRRMRVASCADLWIIGQRSVQIIKEDNLNLSRRLKAWLYLTLEIKLVGTVIYHMFFQYFNIPFDGLILMQTFIYVLMLRYSLRTRSPEILP